MTPARFRSFSLALFLLAACSDDDTGGPSPRSSSGGGGADASATDGGSSSSDGAAANDASSGEDAALGPEESGEATYYNADGTGSCGFPASSDFMVAAMNDEQYTKAVCGKCVSVTGPNGTVVVRIVDLCPGCKSGDLDLSQTAFSKIAKLSDGRVKITWHYVACP